MKIKNTNRVSVMDTATLNTHLGLHIADLDISDLNHGAKILFTFYWIDAKEWEGINYSVMIE